MFGNVAGGLLLLAPSSADSLGLDWGDGVEEEEAAPIAEETSAGGEVAPPRSTVAVPDEGFVRPSPELPEIVVPSVVLREKLWRRREGSTAVAVTATEAEGVFCW